MTTLRPTSISTTPPQPDALLRIDEEVGGPSRISDDYVEGPPELIVGVAHSSAGSDTTECSSKCAAHDLHDQKRAAHVQKSCTRTRAEMNAGVIRFRLIANSQIAT
jgi:hypothetical protein